MHTAICADLGGRVFKLSICQRLACEASVHVMIKNSLTILAPQLS